MGPSEDTGQDTAYPHDRQRTRHGRHGRPGPFGGRLRLPTLRFSGAAMAMSTVVGISIATTLLLSEQQGVGRRAGVARVGSSAPPPSPTVGPDSTPGTASGPAGGGRAGGSASGTTADREAVTPAVPRPGPSDPAAPNHPTSGSGAPGNTPGRPAATPTAPRTGVPLAEGPPPRHGVTGEPAGGHGGTADGGPDTLAAGQTAEERSASRDGGRPAEEPTPTATAPATSAPSPSPTAPRPLAPAPGTPTPPPHDWTGETLTDTGTDGTGEKDVTGAKGDTGGKGDKGGTDSADDLALTGAALVQPLGRDGTRHLLALTVTEPLTALQAEFRLAPGALAPGAGTVWTDLTGAVITAHQERGAAVYRFTTPPGTDVRPGRYTFAVLGIRPPAPRRGDPRTPGPRPPDTRANEPRNGPRANEPRTSGSWSSGSWNASAFAIDRPRAVAALGAFTAPAAAPATAPATAPTPAPAR
ncbi:hypothetical protein ACIQ9P_23510 [Kitasatospora sp. NPDC094019]|uniref:hypothetical protein n=1 Tax=Kitasatospora sp. NPDC094019 TaxID=3364091 RepID=UPI0038005E36